MSIRGWSITKGPFNDCHQQPLFSAEDYCSTHPDQTLTKTCLNSHNYSGQH